jgi:hypothetical protein
MHIGVCGGGNYITHLMLFYERLYWLIFFMFVRQKINYWNKFSYLEKQIETCIEQKPLSGLSVYLQS